MRQCAVIGLGRFGMSVARSLSESGAQVLAIDKDSERVKEASGFVYSAVELDATDKDALRETGIQNVDIGVVGIGRDIASSILITLILKEIGIKTVVSKAFSPLQGEVLKRVGANRIVYPEKEMGVRIATSLTSPEIFDYIELSPKYSLMEINAPKHFENKTLGQLHIRTKYGVSVIGIKRGEEVVIAPVADEQVVENDRLIMIGKTENVAKLKKL